LRPDLLSNPQGSRRNEPHLNPDDMNALCRQGATALVQLVRSREISPVEVVRAFAARIEQTEPVLHAFSVLTLENALERAAQIEHQIAGGGNGGALAGLPIGVKDMLNVRGVPTSFGSLAFRDSVAAADDPVVERLFAAGAISLGKTNTPEFAFSSVGHNPAFPTTTNPWNPDLTPGGSSSGSGAAVAAGQCPAALGTDRAGSIRIPSAHCGIYGFKPSNGLVPGCEGDDPMSTIGPMTRSVADAALMMSVMAGFDPRDRLSLSDTGIDWQGALKGDLHGLHIGYSRDFGYAPVDSQVSAIVERAVQVFERDLGCTVEEFDPGWKDPWYDFLTLCTAGLDLARMREIADRFGSQISPHVVDAVRHTWGALDYTNAEATRRRLWRRMVELTQRYSLLVTPTVAVPPFALLVQGPEQIAGRTVRPMEWIPFTFPVNMCGMPAASVPAGWTARNLPVGMQIIGPRLGDALVLRASAAFERAQPWQHRWPEVPGPAGVSVRAAPAP
jgi:aspartyl-tRNA(Asn)/glutamyl-tRNA(Gln) amidotransferase subunit A